MHQTKQLQIICCRVRQEITYKLLLEENLNNELTDGELELKREVGIKIH